MIPQLNQCAPAWASSKLPAWNKCSAADCFASRGEESIHAYLTAAAKLLQSCLTPWDPTDGSPPGSPIPGILQARILEWAAISFSSLPFFPMPVLSPTLSGKCHFNSGTIPCKSHWRCVPDSCYFCSAIPCSLHLSIVTCLILFFLSNQFNGILESKEIDVYVHSTILTWREMKWPENLYNSFINSLECDSMYFFPLLNYCHNMESIKLPYTSQMFPSLLIVLATIV